MALFNRTQMRAGPDALDALRSTIQHNKEIPPVRDRVCAFCPHAPCAHFHRVVLVETIQAGKVWAAEEDGTAACLRFPEVSTENIKGAAWRHSVEPGVRVRHPAAVRCARRLRVAHDSCFPCLASSVTATVLTCSPCPRCSQYNDVVDTKRVYGTSSQASEHVSDVIEQEPKTVLEDLLRKHGERAYLSTSREPLGKGRVHSGDLPPRVTAQGYTFGMKSASSESAKPLLYPDAPGGAGAGGGESKVPERTARYRGTSGPGEQKTRGYNFANTGIVDPRTHRFGKVDKAGLRDGEGAAIALNPSRDRSARAPAVVAKRVADYRNVAVDQLGRVKSLG